MKRKDKIYNLIGRAVTYIGAYIIFEIGFIKMAMYVFNNCITTLR